MIDPKTLTPEQQAGTACVVDGQPVYPGAYRVGYLGPDEHPVYACCLACFRQLDALVLERDPHRRGPVGDPPADRSAVPVSRWTL